MYFHRFSAATATVKLDRDSANDILLGSMANDGTYQDGRVYEEETQPGNKSTSEKINRGQGRNELRYECLQFSEYLALVC